MESDRKSTTLDLIVKFGGAAITDKSSLETLKPDQLDYGASIIEECYKLGQTVVVVHGAGYGVWVCAREWRVHCLPCLVFKKKITIHNLPRQQHTCAHTNNYTVVKSIEKTLNIGSHVFSGAATLDE